VTVLIADDFATIHARLQDIETARRQTTGQPAEPGLPPDRRPQFADFHAWLTQNGHWTPG
jgi:hypothetical protein